MPDIVLVGKPNSGKTSLFNLLTGLNHKVGNFAGVTVEYKKGKYKNGNIIDLPGLESLQSRSPEEIIAKNQLLSSSNAGKPIIFVANGIQLDHSLMLFSQVADLQTPCIVVVNFDDELKQHHIKLNETALSQRLGCPVIRLNSKTGKGLDQLKELIDNESWQVPSSFNLSFHDEVNGNDISNAYQRRLQLTDNSYDWTADHRGRSQIIQQLISDVVDRSKAKPIYIHQSKWDKVLLHPIGGLLIFFGILYLIFQSVFYFSTFPMDWIDANMGALAESAGSISPEWLGRLLSQAIIPGIAGVIIFIPQIAILFLLIGLLEQIGYMSRISYISDAFLRKFGLSGHSVVPLVSSWACAIPAIMSTRIIENPRERFAVIMASPLMTCSARLPVYAILISILFPNPSKGFFGAQGLALFLLYLLGLVATLAVSYLVSKRSSIKSVNTWALELPSYRFPNWRNLGISVYDNTKSFLVNAGKIIFAISILLWVLASFSPKSDAYIQNEAQAQQVAPESLELEYSYLGYMGKAIEPIVKPLGYDWKIGIALISSFAAREVFVGTLSTIYGLNTEEEGPIIQRLNSELRPNGKKRFDTATAVSLLLFYVFAMQCMSTLAIVKKETGKWKYAIYQFLFMTALAYVFAFGAYHLIG